ncbi:transposase [Xanthomonas fragariae LMG 25863]|nr:transposase [Xanthomonas fragariae LMG 25863]
MKRSPKGGRPRISDQQALNGIVYVLRTGVPWEDLPMELGYGSGMTCWRRLRDWQAAGVWHRLHQVLLAELRRAQTLDLSRAGLDAASVASPPGGPYTGPNPTDRGKLGSKRHLIVDRNGIPLAVCVTGANRHDSVVFEELIDALPPIGGKPGRQRRWPASSSAASLRGSHARGSRATTGWAAIAGSSSAPMPGSQAWANCASALNAASISTWRCSRLLAPSSAYGFFLGFVSRSKSKPA